MGFGTGGFGTCPFGCPSTLALEQAATTAVSCRLIDTVLRDYVTDANGNPSAMDGTANQVYLLLSYADSAVPDIITAAGLAQRQAACVAALAPLTRGATPAISGLSVEFVGSGGGEVLGTVNYWDEGTQQPVTLPVG